MTDESRPLDWFPRPQTWPQWMPNALWNGGLVRPAPPEVSARIAFDWEEGPTGGLIGRPNPLWSRSNARWWESMPSAPSASGSGGVLGSLSQPVGPARFDPGPELKGVVAGPPALPPVAPALSMSGAAGWYDFNPTIGAAPFPWPPKEQPKSESSAAPVSTARDLLRTTPAALARGTTLALGGTGDARELVGKGIEWALQKAGIEASPEALARMKDALRSNPFTALVMAAPTSAELTDKLESVTGPLYQPQTRAGKYLNNALEFVPGAVALGPVSGGLRAIPGVAARYGLIPGLASEAAGHATEGTAAEPWARFGTALATGGAAAYLSHPSMPRGATVPHAPERGAAVPARPAGEPSSGPFVASDTPLPTLGAPERAIGYATHEAVPGAGTGHLPRLLKEPYAVRETYSNDPRSSWINPETRGDVLYETLGSEVLPTRPATGSFTPGSGLAEINPAQVARPKIQMARDSGAIGDASRKMLEFAEHLRAYIDGQNTGAAHALTRNAPREQLNSVNIPLNRRLSPEEMQEVTALADPYGFYGSHRGYSARDGSTRNVPDHIVDPLDHGVSLINKGAGQGGRSAGEIEDLLKRDLGPKIRKALPDAGSPELVKADSVTANFEDLLASANRGQRRATEQLVKILADAPPGTIEALDRSNLFREIAAVRRARDAEMATTMGGVRDDLQRARQIVAERGLRGLIEALARKEVLPSVLAPLGLAGYEASSRGD